MKENADSEQEFNRLEQQLTGLKVVLRFYFWFELFINYKIYTRKPLETKCQRHFIHSLNMIVSS